MVKQKRGKSGKNSKNKKKLRLKKDQDIFEDENGFIFFKYDKDYEKEIKKIKKTKLIYNSSGCQFLRIKGFITKLKAQKLIFRNQSIESLLWQEFKYHKENNLKSIIAFFGNKDFVKKNNVNLKKYKIFQDFTLDELEKSKNILRERLIQTINKQKLINKKSNKKIIELYDIIKNGFYQKQQKGKGQEKLKQKNKDKKEDISQISEKFENVSFKETDPKINNSKNISNQENVQKKDKQRSDHQQEQIQGQFYTQSQEWRHYVVLKQLGLLSQIQYS